MRARIAFVVLIVLSATSVFAKDVYLAVGGSANGFFTDARIVNPSFDKDITITARYLPAGNVDNSAVATRTVTVPKRQQLVFDDVVQSLFGGGPPLGAIRLTSDADFLATQRIYADKRTSRQQGTLGQFVKGLDAAEALRKGIVMQLKAGQAALGNFRTNWGGANPNAVVATINFKLYDKANTVVGTNTLTMQPFGVFSPTSIVPFFGITSADLTDAWFSFESDQPVFVYGSVVDNGSEDPTYVAAATDSGTAPPDPEPEPEPITATVTASNWVFAVSGLTGLRQGDEVRFVISSEEAIHGFQLFSPSGSQLVLVDPVTANAVERIVTLPETGTYIYICSHSACGIGHGEMNGTFIVTAAPAP
ncbi:MAG TPA: hypothetical protein VEK57_29360 [Thermoanaerobaculia bacterium]|nr:hypothetical protein [Thermoanaerobaculia bacterium]